MGRLRAADEQLGMTLYQGEQHGKAAFTGHVAWRALLAMTLFCAAVLFALLVHTWPEGHRATERKLLLGFIVISSALLLALVAVTNSGHVLLAVLAALYAVHREMRSISAGASPSHWLYPLAHPDAHPDAHPEAAGVGSAFTAPWCGASR